MSPRLFTGICSVITMCITIISLWADTKKALPQKIDVPITVPISRVWILDSTPQENSTLIKAILQVHIGKETAEHIYADIPVIISERTDADSPDQFFITFQNDTLFESGRCGAKIDLDNATSIKANVHVVKEDSEPTEDQDTGAILLTK